MAHGLENASFTKVFLIATVGGSIITQAFRASRRPGLALGATLSRLFVFKNSGELFVGAFLLYYFRILERQYGTAKFGAFAVVVTGISTLIHLIASRFSAIQEPPCGPYGLIFACLVQFVYSVPASNKFTVLGLKLNDKAFTYLAALHLMFSGGLSSLTAAAGGVLAGLLYRLDFLGIKRIRMPKAVNRLFERTFGSWLQAGPGQAQNFVSSSSATGRPGHPVGASHARVDTSGHQGGSASQVDRRDNTSQQQQLVHLSEEALSRLIEMGFDRQRAVRALQLSNNDVDAAIGLLIQ
ncbi:hypothetical protein CEUSTIGMA_g13121.t1 [Chlamydomonas eustigma]|uniref:UBA domain-containing protein n=1 Tax=Chlamydomonas eustigma TaxID=1157962 RepID=A0A250XRK3_9CHLO|nr:hypothetical protein CEUSTIGMA_g13121.t1 [Chlamydomonas eustigma]|eukprot:GAX85707.1 hypothetical protein CEUSTIGMA_g13121.t1 [Chlamydomonas eustigma]